MQTDTIGSTSMLVSLELGLPRQTTQLVKQAGKIEHEANAEEGTVTANCHYFRRGEKLNITNADGSLKFNKDGTVKTRWVKTDGLQKLKDFQNEYKQAMLTLARYPYTGTMHLLPAPAVEDMIKVRHKYETGQNALLNTVWTDWADNDYPDLSSTAPQRMGNLYRADDFPPLHDCKARFTAKMTIVPLAEADQVKRIALISPSSQELLIKHADEKAKASIDQLHVQIWADFMKPLQHIVDTFTKDKPKIYESLLGNLLEIVNVIPNYKALTQDADLMKAAEEVKAVFSSITTKDLKTSEEARKNALTTAKDLVAKFQPFARKFA